MDKDTAMATGLGYAWGHEDASGIVTLNGTGEQTATYAFAYAYAQAWDDYNKGLRGSMFPVGDAYETWQSSGGRSVFKPGDSTTDHQARSAQWRADAIRKLTEEIN